MFSPADVAKYQHVVFLFTNISIREFSQFFQISLIKSIIMALILNVTGGNIDSSPKKVKITSFIAIQCH